MSLLNDMHKSDKGSKAKAALQLKTRDTLARLSEENLNNHGLASTDKTVSNVTKVFTEGHAGGVTKMARSRRKNAILREEKRQDVYGRISEDLTEIVIKGLSIDEDVISERKESLTENIQNVFMGIFNKNLVTPRMLIENKSSIVRGLARFSILQEDLDDDEKLTLISDAEKVAGAIKAKTDEIIKDEVKNAKKKKEVEDSLKGDDDKEDDDKKDDKKDDDMDMDMDMDDKEGDDKEKKDDDSEDDDSSDSDDSLDDLDDGDDDSDDDSSDSDDKSEKDEDDDDKEEGDDESDDDNNVNISINVDADDDDDDDKKKKKKKKGLNESASLGIHRTIRDTRKGTFMRFLRESAKEYAATGSLDMDKAIGDASIKYAILECLNTMNLVTDKNKQALIERLNN